MQRSSGSAMLAAAMVVVAAVASAQATSSGPVSWADRPDPGDDRPAAVGHSSSDSDETAAEQSLAVATAGGGWGPELGQSLLGQRGVGSDYPLFTGLDDVVLDATLHDPATSATLAAFTGVAVWGAAYDEAADRVLFSTSSNLYQWPVGGGAPTLLGSVTLDGATRSPVGLAYHDGVLYATTNTAPEGIFTVNLSTLAMTMFIDYDDALFDVGGLAVDPATGTFYGTNDDVDLVGLVRFSLDGSAATVTTYPSGESDIDGLAIGEGRAYLVTDDPGDAWGVYDLSSRQWVGTVSSPYPSAETFAAATWVRPRHQLDTVAFGWNGQAGEHFVRFSDWDYLHDVAGFPPPSSFVGAGELIGDRVYMVDGANTLWEVDPISGEVLRTLTITAAPSGHTWTGMAYDALSGVVYLGSTSLSSSSLATLDLVTGVATPRGTVTNSPGLIALAVDGNGTLWGYDLLDDTLLVIEKTLGFGTVIGPIGFDANFAQGMDWDPISDTLYMAAFNNTTFRAELRTVDRSSGETTFIGVLGYQAPGGLNHIPWLGFPTAAYLSEFSAVFANGFETGTTASWAHTVY